MDSGRSIANGTQLRVTWDFDGNGTPDRVETWRYFATDDLLGWQTYPDGWGLRSVTGAWRDLAGGTVTAEVWSAIGTGTTQLRVDGTSWIVLPFAELRVQ